jgi:hypothetical protein
MKDSEFNHYYNNLNKFNDYLDKPNIIDPPATCCCSTLAHKISVWASQLFKRIARLLNYCFGDHHWYSESKAREVIQLYIIPEKITVRNPEYSQKILDIYDRLHNLKMGNGRQSDGINFANITALQEEINGGPDLPPENPEPVKPDPIKPPSPRRPIDPYKPPSPRPIDPYIPPYIPPIPPKPLPPKPKTADELLLEEFSKLPTIKPLIKTAPKSEPTATKADTSAPSSHVFRHIQKLESSIGTGAHIGAVRMSFHIHANRFGYGSGLEGDEVHNPLAYLTAYYQQHSLSSNAVMSEIIKDMATALSHCQKSLPEYIESAQRAVADSFSQKKPTLFAGGWTGEPSGHAMYYEIIPTSENKASFRLYNLGGGSDYHQRVTVGKKNKCVPYQEWQGIDREKLMEPSLWTAFHELNNLSPPKGIKTEYNADDIYVAIHRHLAPQAVKRTDDPKILMTPQTAGICAIRSPLAFLRTRLEEKLGDEGYRIYKRIKCDLTVQSIVDTVRSQNLNPLTGQVEWRLVNKSYQKLCRRIEKLRKKNIIGDEYLLSTAKYLEEVDAWVKKGQGQFIKDEYPYLPVFQEPRDYIPISAPKEPLQAQLKEDLAKTAIDGSPEFTELMKTYSLDVDPWRLSRKLEEIMKLGEQAWLDGKDQALHVGLQYYIEHLPEADDALWKKIGGESEQLINLLGQVSKIYFKSCFTVFHSDMLLPERPFALARIQKIQEKLAANLLTKKKVAGGALLYPEGSLYFKYYDHFHYEGVKKLGTHRDFSQVDINERVSFTQNGPVGESSSISCDRWNRKQDFVNVVTELVPDIESRIKAQNSNFEFLSPEQKAARIYTCPYLPEWLVSLRDTNLYLHFLMHEPVGKSTTLDRESDFKLSFKLKDNEEEACKIMPQFSGITGVLVESYPSIREVREDSYKQFSEIHGHFSNPELERFCLDMSKNPYNFTEKKLLANRARSYGLTIEDYHELVHLFLAKEVKLFETLEYFTKYPEKLKNRDYQIIFKLLIFSCNLKNAAQPKIFEHLAEFLHRNFIEFRSQNEIQPCVFLLQISKYLSEFYPDKVTSDGVRISADEALENLRGLLKRPGLEIEEKSAIYTELVSHLSVKFSGEKNRDDRFEEILSGKSKSTNLNDKDLEDLLVGIAYLNRHPIPIKWEDPIAYNDLLKVSLLHREAIINFVKGEQNVNTLMARVMRELKPDAPSYNWTSEVNRDGSVRIVTSDNRYAFLPFSCRLISNVSEEVFLPFEIRNHPDFKKLFPNVNQAAIFGGSKKEIYKFEDKNGNSYFVQYSEDELIIELYKDHKKYRYLPSSTFIKVVNDKVQILIGSRYLINHYSAWLSLETGEYGSSEIHLLDDSKQVKFRVTLGERYGGKNVKSIYDESTQLYLAKTSDGFTDFENTHYIHSWFEKKESVPEDYYSRYPIVEYTLKRLEFPRFGLSFSKKGDQLECDQIPGYFLKSNKRIGFLGSLKNYLVLENAEGKQKVLIPHQKYETDFKKEVLEPAYIINREVAFGQEKQQTYITYDVSKIGEKEVLASQSKKDCLYLAQVLTLNQEYVKAAGILRKYGEKLTPYTKDEAEILAALMDLRTVTGDGDGNALSLFVYAGYLLLKNGCSHNKQFYKIEYLETTYRSYLDKHANATVLKLTTKEEIFLLRDLLSNGEKNEIFLSRLRELSPEQALRWEAHDKKEKAEVYGRVFVTSSPANMLSELLPKDYSWEYSQLKPNIKETFLTRLEKPIKGNFLGFYKLATRGTPEEKQWLLLGINYLKASNDNDKRTLGYIFECLLKHGDEFPPFPAEYINVRDVNPSVERKATISAWINSVKEIINREYPKIDQYFGLSKPEILSHATAASQIVEEEAVLANHRMALEWDFEGVEDQNGFEPCLKFFNEIRSSKKIEVMTDLLPPATGEALVDRERNRLIDDEQSYLKIQNESSYSLSRYDLDNLQESLKSGQTSSEGQLKRLEKRILDQGNKVPEGHLARSKHNLLLGGGKLQELSLDDLIVNFSRQDAQALHRKNPALNAQDISIIYQDLGQYLLLAAKEQQRQRAVTALNKLLAAQESASPEEIADLTKQLRQTLAATRHYAPLRKHLPMLVFEYYANIKMRKNQVEKLNLFLDTGDINPMMEMIMGSGKSKVLLPLLGLLRANEDTLSMIFEPQSLFESVTTDTQAILQASFGQAVRSLDFDRNTEFTLHSLQTILEDLISIQKNRECLMMNNRSMQSLMLKFIETYYKYTQGENKGEELHLLRQILNRIKYNGKPLIDEADTVLDVMRALCFSMGIVHAPDPVHTHVISEVLKTLFTDKRLKALARIESDPEPNMEAPALTETLYEALKKPLAEAFVARLPTIIFESIPTNDAIARFVRQLDIRKKELLIRYLSHDKTDLEETQAFYDRQDPLVKDILALAGEEIGELFKHTLTRPIDSKYGLDPSPNALPIAIPYFAANTPSFGSQFLNPNITMNYTFQTYIKKGIDQEMLVKEINRLQQQAIRESREGSAKGRLTIEETKAWKTFLLLRGKVDMPLFNFKTKQLEEVLVEVNKSIDTKRSFIEQIVMPQMELYDKQLSCNPANLISFFMKGKVSGFTGTLWNADSMGKTKPIYEEGIAALTHSILYQNSRNAVVTLKEDSVVNMSEQLRKINHDMLIDAGGYFKAGGNLQIARQLAMIHGKPVVFYDSQGAQAITDGTTESLLATSILKESERFTFLDQSHTTGADVPQKTGAVGLVTISPHMLRRDLEQSVWRLRGLDRSQKVIFVVSENVDAIIRQTLKIKDKRNLTYDDIFRFTFINQCRQQGKSNFKAFTGQIADIPQRILLAALLHEGEGMSEFERFKVFKYLNSEWIKSGIKKPSESYGTLATEQLKKDVVHKALTTCEEKLTSIFKEFPFLEKINSTGERLSLATALKEARDIAATMINCLPEKILTGGTDLEQSMEIQQQMETQAEKELEVTEDIPKVTIKLGTCDNDQLSTPPKIEPRHLAEGFKSTPSFPISYYFQEDPVLAMYADAFDGLSASINVAEWADGSRSAKSVKMLGTYRTPLHFALLRDDGMHLLSQNDALVFKADNNLFNLTLGLCNTTFKLSDKQRLNVIKAKFLNGVSSYTADEKVLLTDWLKKVGSERMRTFFFDHVIGKSPNKTHAYYGSTLQAVFNALKQ